MGRGATRVEVADHRLMGSGRHGRQRHPGPGPRPAQSGGRCARSATTGIPAHATLPGPAVRRTRQRSPRFRAAGAGGSLVAATRLPVRSPRSSGHEVPESGSVSVRSGMPGRRLPCRAWRGYAARPSMIGPNGEQRPADPIANAARGAKLATGEAEERYVDTAQAGFPPEGCVAVAARRGAGGQTAAEWPETVPLNGGTSDFGRIPPSPEPRPRATHHPLRRPMREPAWAK